MPTIDRNNIYAPDNSDTFALLAEEVDFIKEKYPDSLKFIYKDSGNQLFNQLVAVGLIQFQFMSVVPGQNVQSQRYKISETNNLRNWLNNLPIEDSAEVFICPQYGTENSQSISLPWHIIKTECSVVFGLEYPKDDTTFFDETGRWVLLYNHNDYIDFAAF